MEPSSVDLIIEKGTVVTMDAEHRIIDDGAVAIRGREIVAVDTTAAIREAYVAERVMDATHKVVMPGLVDTYGHAGHGMIRAIRHPELGWPTNELYFHATDEDWWYAEGLLTNLERLRFGVTCGVTVIGATPARMDSPVFAERQAEAVEQVGLRGVLGVGPPDPYVSHLPEPWEATRWVDGRPQRRHFTYRQALDNSVAFIEAWHGGAEGRVQAALHYPYLLGRHVTHLRFAFSYDEKHIPVVIEKAMEIRELADRHDVLIHSHAFRGSGIFGREHFGAERLERLLGPDVVLAHCNNLAPEDIELFGAHGVGIAVVPFTNENIVNGPCPAVELLQAGANVTISTDGTAPYCSYDLFKEIGRAMWTQWERFDVQRMLPPGKALRMVTIDAARALGLGERIGSLEPGKRADVILVDFNRPHLVPSTAIARLLAFYVNGNDVETVIVDGRVLMEDGQVVTVDQDQVLERARRAAARAFERFDVEPYLEESEDFWEGWTY